MLEFLYRNFENVLCVVILVGRLGDIGSTYLVTPNLELEMNPIARRLRWPFAWATLLLCLVPYWNTALAVPLAVVSLLVTALNIRNAWFARALGEKELLEAYVTAAGRSTRRRALASAGASSLFFIVTGLLLLLFYPDPREWAFWYAGGIVMLGLVLGIHSTVFIVRVFKEADVKAHESA